MKVPTSAHGCMACNIYNLIGEEGRKDRAMRLLERQAAGSGGRMLRRREAPPECMRSLSARCLTLRESHQDRFFLPSYPVGFDFYFTVVSL